MEEKTYDQEKYEEGQRAGSQDDAIAYFVENFTPLNSDSFNAGYKNGQENKPKS
jgi:hypothetical protein